MARNKKLMEDYREFKLRTKEDPDYCLELFHYATVRLLAFKYAYYVLNKYIAEDIQYDGEEKCWYLMGRALKLLDKNETSPCVGFDAKHVLAQKGMELAISLPTKRG